MSNFKEETIIEIGGLKITTGRYGYRIYLYGEWMPISNKEFRNLASTLMDKSIKTYGSDDYQRGFRDAINSIAEGN